MLTKIRLKNFRTFKEGTVIDFAATKYSKLKDSNVKDGVVKSCMFVGGNATGKSNVIAAMSALLYLLFDDSGTNMPVNFCSFSDEKYMEMEYIFRFGHDKVAYSLSFDREGRVRSEKVVLYGQTLLDRIDRGARTSLGNSNFYGSGEVEERSLIFCVQYDEIFRKMQNMNFLFEKLNAKSVKRADVAQIKVTHPAADTLFHFVGGFIRKGNAQDISC